MPDPEVVESDRERCEKAQREETSKVYHNRLHPCYDMNSK